MGDILRQTKLQSAEQVLLDETMTEPIYIEGTAVVNETIERTGPPSANDPRTDPASLSHGNRTQHPYNASSDGTDSTVTLEALENLCRAHLLIETPHLQGLLFRPYAPTAPDSGESHGNSDSSDMSEDDRIPTEGKDGAAAKTPL